MHAPCLLNNLGKRFIEIDGSGHDNQIEADRERQDVLEVLGLNVLRINADMIENNLPFALNEIRAKIAELKSPSPFIGAGLRERVLDGDD